MKSQQETVPAYNACLVVSMCAWLCYAAKEQLWTALLAEYVGRSTMVLKLFILVLKLKSFQNRHSSEHA